MTRARFLIIPIFFVLHPLAADDTLRALLDKSPYADDGKQSILSVFSLARELNVPDSFLIPRLEEGLAKRATASMLVPVLKLELDFLVRARNVLSSADPSLIAAAEPSMWQRAALLLRSGVPDSVIGAIGKASGKRRQDFRAAADLYLSLTSWGLASAESEMIAVTVLGSRLPAEEFAGVAALFPKGRSRDLNPHVLARRIVKNLPLVRTVAELADRVLY